MGARRSIANGLGLDEAFVSKLGWTVSGRVTAALAAVAASVLLARILPPHDLGVYFLVLGLVGGAATVGQAGLGQAIVQIAGHATGAGDAGRARRVVTVGVRLTLLASMIVASIVVVVGGSLLGLVIGDPIRVSVLLLAASLVVLVALQNVIVESLRGLGDITSASLCGGMVGSVTLVVVLVALFLGGGARGIESALAASAAAGLVVVLSAGPLLRRKVAQLPRRAARVVRDVEVLTVGSRIVVAEAAVILSGVDVWILGLLRSEQEVATFGVIARLGMLIALPLVMVNGVSVPRIARLYGSGRHDEVQGLLRVSAGIAFVPTACAGTALALLGPWVLEVVYGTFYGKAGIPLGVVVVGQMVNVWAGSCRTTLVMTGHERLMMRIALGSSALGIATCVPLVAWHGVSGAALALALRLVCQNLAMWMAVRLTAGLWTHAPVDAIVLGMLRHSTRTFRGGTARP